MGWVNSASKRWKKQASVRDFKLCQIGNPFRFGRLPSQCLPGQDARGGHVEACEYRKLPEKRRYFVC